MARSVPLRAGFPLHPSDHPHSFDPLNSTALKWCSNGELSELDLHRILSRLSQVDPVAGPLDPQACDLAS
ncbi:hypothetical protein VB716_12880 [Synechococcus sp. CCY9201]|jgi:hypothetical protein|uniref:hypothetical protein n=1 Tax=unclassified Synechococcus TaxID=2626047 RepID=UPI002B21C624|nr:MULTISPECIES: hypothetical protein [unclassified Synechococcus]MEA5475115.1 hypothetical protein [Synechococcus sp. CCY9201]CAK6691815.1 hypothetical protein IFHNHDMJ_01092 [Synechococcus sp. CBW1107]